MAQHYNKSIPVASLSDAQLIALFLTRRGAESALQRATSLIHKAGSLQRVVNSSCIAEDNVSYLTGRQQLAIDAGMEISRRIAYDSIQGREVLASPEQVRHFLALHMAHLEHEVFAAIFLDNRHRVIQYREMFNGTIDSAAVYPREVVKQCLACNAAAILFCHGHPSGVAEPSDTDVRLTRKLTDALALIDVRVLDHIVIGKGEMTSLAERGLM